MDKLTKEWFELDFPGGPTSVEVADDPFDTDAPIVEIESDIDVEFITEICRIKHETDRTDYKDQMPPYQKLPRTCNLYISLLWNHGTRPIRYIDLRNRKDADPPPLTQPDERSLKVEEHLKSKGLNLDICCQMNLQSQGYFRPHRDMNGLKNLMYVWIPLTYPIGSSLKFYPHGEYKPKLGNYYLFNQHTYTHAIQNMHSDECRYALVGHLNPELTDTPEFRQLVRDNINKQYNEQTNHCWTHKVNS